MDAVPDGQLARTPGDLNGDGIFTGAGELDEESTFNAFKQLLTRDTPTAHALEYDANGNTITSSTHDLVYDPMGRLRRVLLPGTSTLVAEYTYNALGYRITWHYDVNEDAATDGDDPVLHLVYDDRWRLRAVYGADDDDAREHLLPHQAGLDGEGGSSYIDLYIMRDRSSTKGPGGILAGAALGRSAPSTGPMRPEGGAVS